jgi:DNA-binding Xre family transcriptional regulator
MLLPTVRLQPALTEARTGRPTSRRRQALLQTEAGQALHQRALKDLGGALDQHGLAPLAALRLRHGLTQKALCDASGLPQPHLSRLENGRVTNPDAATLERLAAALGVSMDEVMKAIQQGAAA